jgi:hypothetical protein
MRGGAPSGGLSPRTLSRGLHKSPRTPCTWPHQSRGQSVLPIEKVVPTQMHHQSGSGRLLVLMKTLGAWIVELGTRPTKGFGGEERGRRGGVPGAVPCQGSSRAIPGSSFAQTTQICTGGHWNCRATYRWGLRDHRPTQGHCFVRDGKNWLRGQ